MLNPKNMDMVSRSFDGMSTMFSDADSNRISVRVYALSKDYDFDESYKTYRKNYAERYTLNKAENDASGNVKTMHFQYRSGILFYDERYYITDKYEYTVTVITTPDGTHKDEVLDYAASFKLSFEEEDTHDLSNLEDGMRKFESEELNFTLYLPANFNRSSTYYTKMNSFTFLARVNSSSGIDLNIYSADTIDGTIEKYIEEMRDGFMRPRNEELSKCQPIVSHTYNNFSAWQFDYTVTGSKSDDGYGRILAFIKDDYLYTLSAWIDANDDVENPAAQIDAILDKADFRTIDAEKVGILLASESEYTTETKEETIGKATFSIPKHYGSTKSSIFSVYSSDYDWIGCVVGVEAQTSSQRVSAREYADQVIEQLLVSGQQTTIVQKNSTFKAKYMSFQTFTLKIETDHTCTYSINYICEKNGVLYMLSFSASDLYYSDHNRTVAENIVQSFSVES